MCLDVWIKFSNGSVVMCPTDATGTATLEEPRTLPGNLAHELGDRVFTFRYTRVRPKQLDLWAFKDDHIRQLRTAIRSNRTNWTNKMRLHSFWMCHKRRRVGWQGARRLRASLLKCGIHSTFKLINTWLTDITTVSWWPVSHSNSLWSIKPTRLSDMQTMKSGFRFIAGGKYWYHAQVGEIYQI